MPPKTERAKLKKIPTTSFQRGLEIAKLSLGAGAKAASFAFQKLGSTENEKADLFKKYLFSQAQALTQGLSKLKGSMMKSGQMLSVYGEHFLPEEVNAVLRTLHSQSEPVEWKVLEKILKNSVGNEALKELEIDPEPYAAASLGQVHLATRKRDGLKLAVKIQYPGIAEAIDSDLKSLKSMLVFAKIIPKSQPKLANTPSYDDLFDEVKVMLKQEVDYSKELEWTEKFRALLKDDPRFIVPKTFPEYSGKRVLVTQYQEGITIDDPQIQALSQARRNALGSAFGELGLMELWKFHLMQTDAHFGNYKIQLGKSSSDDKIVLLDFGAVRSLPKGFIAPYLQMTQGAYEKDCAKIIQGALKLGFLREDDTQAMKDLFCEVCIQFTEPFQDPNTPYDWGRSDLPKRVSLKGSKLVVGFRLRPPPREIIFVDRKLAGTFMILSRLKVVDQFAEVLKKYLYT